MKRLLAVLFSALPLLAQGGEYQSSLVVQTGELRESDLVIRNITDLTGSKTCLAFYVRTTGTSPAMVCYDAAKGFGARITQVSHFKEKDLVVRKVQDFKNDRACIVTYVSTQGTSPSIDCFPNKQTFKESIQQDGHIREGDLDVRRIVDQDSLKTCLVTYVDTKRTSPSLKCYDTIPDGRGGLVQVSEMREGDLIVRKIIDQANHKACLLSYVSTPGTRTHMYCFDQQP